MTSDHDKNKPPNTPRNPAEELRALYDFREGLTRLIKDQTTDPQIIQDIIEHGPMIADKIAEMEAGVKDSIAVPDELKPTEREIEHPELWKVRMNDKLWDQSTTPEELVQIHKAIIEFNRSQGIDS